MIFKTHEGTFDIQPFDGLFRYQVKNSFSGETYLVDLLEYFGSGRCSCQDFNIRCAPGLERRFGPGEPCRCKHIRAARCYLGIELVERLIRNSLK